jgi:trigger factor
MPDKFDRPPIPLPIQREVRQRCGFGCVICGIPLYEYEHMLEWAVVQRHITEEITLLCDKHHREKTSGLLPKEDVTKANENPHNLIEGVSKPYDLHYSGSECEVFIGSNSFTTIDKGYGTQIIPVIIDEIPIVGFIMSEGHLLLTLNLFDDFNNFILRIVNNELVYKVTSWDIQFVGRNLIIRKSKGDILIDITFEVPNKIIINRGKLRCNGIDIVISPTSVVIDGKMTYSGGRIENIPAGFVIGRFPGQATAFCRMENISRYSK